jgi:hypothetical protein
MGKKRRIGTQQSNIKNKIKNIKNAVREIRWAKKSKRNLMEHAPLGRGMDDSSETKRFPPQSRL